MIRQCALRAALTGIVAGATLFAASARAAIPPAVDAMIREAARSGDDATLGAVVKVAKATNPDNADAIGALAASLQSKEKARAEKEHREKLAARGLFEGWKGEGQLGAGLSTGNTSETSAVLGLTLERDGLQSRHKLIGLVDYLRTNGATERQKYALDYALNLTLNRHLYVVGTLGWEQDRFAGYARRFTESVGLGYRAIDTGDMKLDLEAGPALRETRYIVDGGDTGDGLAGRGSLDWRWTIRNGVTLTENASALAQRLNTTLVSTMALTTRINGALSARLSYNVQKETDPPDGLKSTDTATRGTLVYGF